MNFEIILIKQLISSPEFFNKVFGILELKYFTEVGTQKIFGIIKNYFKEYHKIPTLVEIASKVKDISSSEIRKELVETIKEINNTDISNNIDFLCNETVSFVKDALYLEALTIGAEGLQKKSDELKAKAQNILDLRAKISINEDLGLDYDDMDKMIDYFSTRNIGILTQHNELNKRLGCGFLPGTLSVILAGQSVGKSLMMCDLICGMLTKNKNVLLVSLEMSDYEMMKRIYANTLNIDINSFSDLSKTTGELEQLDRNITTKDKIINSYQELKLNGSLGKFFVKDYPSCSFTSLQLESLVQKFENEKQITFDCIFIDYLGIMKSDILSPNVGLYSYIKSIGEELRASAKKLNVAIISASQLNRGAVNKIDDVDASAIADSLGTQMTADFSLFLLQNEELKSKCEIVCKVTKNRFNGRTDTWIMGIDYPKMKFYDIVTTNNQTFESEHQKKELTNYVNSEISKINYKASKELKKEQSTKEDDNIDNFLKSLGV